MNLFSKIVIPVFIVFVVFYGFKKKINIYESFLEGAKEGLIISFNIFPSIFCIISSKNGFVTYTTNNPAIPNGTKVSRHTLPFILNLILL